MADGYSLARGRSVDEVQGGAPTTPKVQPSSVPEAQERGLTDFDLAAYDKNEFSLSMEKNVMRSMELVARERMEVAVSPG